MEAMTLEPCPFCGTPGVIGDSFAGMGRECWIACCNNSDCHASEVVVDMPTKQEAIAAWNTRAPSAHEAYLPMTGNPLSWRPHLPQHICPHCVSFPCACRHGGCGASSEIGPAAEQAAKWNRRAHLAQPAQAVDVVALRELVEKWRKRESRDRSSSGEYYSGRAHAYDTCSDELEASLTRALSGEKAGPVGDGWRGLTDDEQAKFVGTICDYGTEFVTPLFSVIDSVETILRKRNTASPTPDKEGA